MKRFLLLALYSIIACTANKVLAQTFTVPNDTVTGTYVSGTIELHNNITNTSANPVKITWSVVPDSSDFPPSWTIDSLIGICDNSVCTNNNNNQLINGTPKTSADYLSGIEGDFHLQVNLMYGIPGSHHLVVKMVNGSTVKYTTFIINKFASGVGTVARPADYISLYPNPAKSFLNVTFSPEAGIKNIAVFNLIGKIVNNYKVTGSSAQLDISEIPSGIYYLRIFNNQGHAVATRRFTHQ